MSEIVVECPECDEIGAETKVDHEPGTRQYQGVKDAHWLIVTEHNESTGHNASMRVVNDGE